MFSVSSTCWHTSICFSFKSVELFLHAISQWVTGIEIYCPFTLLIIHFWERTFDANRTKDLISVRFLYKIFADWFPLEGNRAGKMWHAFFRMHNLWEICVCIIDRYYTFCRIDSVSIWRKINILRLLFLLVARGIFCFYYFWYVHTFVWNLDLQWWRHCRNGRSNFSHIARIKLEYRCQIQLFIANQDS